VFTDHRPSLRDNLYESKRSAQLASGNESSLRILAQENEVHPTTSGHRLFTELATGLGDAAMAPWCGEVIRFHLYLSTLCKYLLQHGGQSDGLIYHPSHM
jgi:hypothetical protein